MQGKVNDNSDDDSVMMRLLVPSKVIGCLIGKGGYIINEMRKKTKADIRISKGEKPKCAADDEELVEVWLADLLCCFHIIFLMNNTSSLGFWRGGQCKGCPQPDCFEAER